MKNLSHKFISLCLVLTILLSMCCTSLAAHATFPDTPGHWAEDTINELAKGGIILGYDDGRCCPDETITRSQFAALIARYFELTADKGDTSHFKDIPEHWAARHICGLINEGIILPSDFGNTYDPDSAITRMEMIKMMVRAIGKEADAVSKCGTTKFADDVTIQNADSGYINVAVVYDIVNGYPNGNVAPYQTATRAEGFVMLKRLIAAFEKIQAEKDKEANKKPPVINSGSSVSRPPRSEERRVGKECRL